MTYLTHVKARLFMAGWLSLAIIGGAFIGACAHHHRDDGRVVVVDEHGYRHEGYYDANRHWHGGWYDEHNVRHDDPYDWRQ